MTHGDTPQNIYDDQRFFAGYTQLPRFQAAFGNAMEHGPFLEMTGNVTGMRVLDIGCGGGQLAYHLAQAGAQSVEAIDASARMLEFARSQYAHERVTYRQVAMEDASYPDDAFHLVVSSLAFHYVRDYESLMRRVARWLTDGGLLVFSTEHPIYAARATDEGWVRDSDSRDAGWAIDDYAVEGMRERQWFVSGVQRYHRTMATLLNVLIDAGFRIERLWESYPDEAWLRDHPDHAEELRRPMFLLVKARKA